MRLQLQRCTVRTWRPADLASLVRHANNRRIWDNLRDRFPHPYREEDGREFLTRVLASDVRVWAIDVGGDAVGGIGLEPLTDVERVSAEIGYWLGEEYWGRGIVTEAVQAITTHAFEHSELSRIFALPFADNTGSIRVLEKAGYVLEGRLRQSAIKAGRLRDQLMYAAYRPRYQ